MCALFAGALADLSMPRFCVLALAVLVTACSSDSPAPPPTTPPVASHEDIAWYPGDISAAFALAKAQGKPVFLYWGAVWCPPCQQVKATIFKRPEFVERTRLVVPIYLDGDSPSAQKHAEEFGVVGYPTMIVFRPDGTEITRLPGGVDIELYNSVLDAAIADLKPVKDLIATAARDPATLAANDWRLLAYYSWDTDADRVGGTAAPAVVQGLVASCPPSVELDCVRLKLTLGVLVAAEKDKPSIRIDQRDLVATLNKVLERPQLLKSDLRYVLYNADDLLKVATAPGSAERKALVERWQKVLDAIANDESVSRTERVATGYTRVALAKLDTTAGPLPAEALASARERAAWGDRVTTDPYERQAVINIAGAALAEAGLSEEASDLLTRELKVSKSPYYFMLDIAESAQKRGHYEEALSWLERAYNESQGPATRFQWGVNYLLGLIQMAPADHERIERVGLAVFDELDRSKEGIYQRTRIRLERLDQALSDWNKSGKHEAVITALRHRLHEVCTPVAATEAARRTCDEFLARA
jgi:thioredoxin-related protein